MIRFCQPMEIPLKIWTVGLVLAALGLCGPAAAQAPAAPKPAVAPENTLTIELKSGKVVIQLLPDIAPKHVERVRQLAREGFYNNIVFHRVINGFMAQTGDPTGTGTGGSKLGNLKAEFSPYTYKRGTVGAARTANPDTANSQFFICFNDMGCKGLTGQYTVWGQVIEGMENVDKIERGEPPATPDRMIKVTVGK